MVTTSGLRNLDIGKMETAAKQWSDIAAKLNGARDSFNTSVVQPLKREAWKGDTGRNATRICDNIRIDIEAVAIEAQGAQKFIDDVVNGSGDGFGNLRTHKQNLSALHNEAISKNLDIDDDGSVHIGPVFRSPGPLSVTEQQQLAEQRRQASELEKKVKAVLKAATDVDDALERGLKVIFGTEKTFRTEHRDRATKGIVDNDWDGMDDTEETMAWVAMALKWYYNYDDAGDLLNHFLDGSGKPYKVDGDRLLSDIPTFQKDVGTTLSGVKNLPDGPFQTEWKSTRSPETESLNWYWGLHHFNYRVVGEKHGGQVTYHVEVEKRYNWGIPSEHRRDLEKGIGPMKIIDLEQADVARLNMNGQAKDFDVYGSTTPKTVTLQ